MIPVSYIVQPKGVFPNNPTLPLVLYPGVLDLDTPNPGKGTAALFESNSWWLTWQGPVYDFHHFQAASHEVLGAISGWGDIMFGGPEGIILSINVSDVVIIPAGVSHMRIASSSDFEVVGAYPVGQSLDMRTSESAGFERLMRLVNAVPLPAQDPVYGKNGPLFDLWKSPI